MKRVLRLSGIVLGGLLAVLLAAGVVLYLVGGSRLDRRHDVRVPELVIPIGDEAAVARGRHLAEAVLLCHGCHGDNLEGGVLVDEPALATIHASNLTSGRGGIGATYSDVDLVRAIRHGVNPQGRGLMIMHSDAYNKLGEEDLRALVAYIRSVAPVDNVVPATRAAPLGRVFVALGMFDNEAVPLIPAEVIDHTAPLRPAPAPAATAEYGGYLVSLALCAMCHGPRLSGGPPIEAGAPAAPNVASYAAPGVWTEEQFIRTIRTGQTPSGKALDGESMPWEAYARMTDDELLAIWRYMGSLNDR